MINRRLRPEKRWGILLYLDGSMAPLFMISPNTGSESRKSRMGQSGFFHHWGEPLYGYYIPMIIDPQNRKCGGRGVDVIFYVTNAFLTPPCI